MSKKDKIIETIEVEDASLLPELLDGKHHVIPIVTGGDEVAEEVEVPEIIPILTLRSSVLFPGAITPITVGRDKSISLVRAVNAEGGILGAVLQRESDVEDPAPDDMYKVGTAARIIKILEMPNGNLTVILNGLEKIEIREYITTEPYFRARVTALRDTTPDLKSIEFEALVDSIRDVALNIIRRRCPRRRPSPSRTSTPSAASSISSARTWSLRTKTASRCWRPPACWPEPASCSKY